MLDIATLGYEIDSRPAAKAAADLDRMSAAGKRAEDQAARLAGVSTKANGELAGSMDKTSRAAKEMTLAQEAVNRALMGHGAAANAARPALVALVGVFGGLATAAALVGGVALALGFRDIRNEAGNLATGMGLTQKQMDRLKKSGESLHITMGDVFIGFTRAVKEVFAEPLDDAEKRFNAFMDKIAAGAAKDLLDIVGFFGGAFETIKTTWSQIPAVIGDAVTTAANAVIGAINVMVRSAIDGINRVLAAAKTVAAGLPMGLGAVVNALPGSVEGPRPISPLDNPNQGAMRGWVADMPGAWQRGRDGAQRLATNVYDSTVGHAADVRRENIRDAAGRAGKSDAERIARLREQLLMEEKVARARATGDEAAIKAMEELKRAAELAARYKAAGFGNAEAMVRARQMVDWERQAVKLAEQRKKIEEDIDVMLAGSRRRMAREDAYAQRQVDLARDRLMYELSIAQALGEPRAIAARERELWIAERINELRRLDSGLSLDAAVARAGAENMELRLAESSRNAARHFVDVISAGNGWADVAGRKFREAAFNRLEDMFTNVFKQIGQSEGGVLGTLARGVGSIFAGFRAYGGPVEANRAYIVGERRPEVFIPSVPGRIEPSVTAGGQAVNVSFAPTYNVQGSGPEIAALRQQMERDRAEFPAMAVRAVSEAGGRRVSSAGGGVF